MRPAIETRYLAGVPVPFDDFAWRCGHFDADAPVNAGYGCRHPEQEERQEDEAGRARGCCHIWSCPLAVELAPETEPADRALLDTALGGYPDGPGEWSDDHWVVPLADGR